MLKKIFVAVLTVGILAVGAFIFFNPIAFTRVLNIDDSNVSASLKNTINAPGPPHRSAGQPNYPSGQVVVLRIATADYPPNTGVSPTLISEFFSGHCGQMNYWNNNSLGAFKPNVALVSPWIQLPQDLGDYGNWENDAPFRIAALEEANMNLRPLDLNNDKIISRSEAVLLLLVPYYDPSSKYERRASRRDFTGLVRTELGDFQFQNVATIMFTTKSASEPDALVDPLRESSVYAHEFGHAFFDLPDRYRAGTGNGFTGQYDIMTADRTWELLPAYDRVKLGWIKPKVLTPQSRGLYEFRPSNFSPEIVALIDPAKPGEYWLIEYRTKLANLVACPYDSGLPEDGIAIWWVKENAFPGTQWSGYDDIRLVSAALPDQDPDGSGPQVDSNNVPIVGSISGYYSPKSDALFQPESGFPVRDLYYSDGTKSKFSFRIVNLSSVSARVWLWGD